MGVGRLGSALGRALHAAGHTIAALADASGGAEALGRELGAGTAVVHTEGVPERAQLVFLAVPDGVIAELAQELQVSAGQALVHTSGALGLDALAPARARGAVVGAFHPLQSFPVGAGAERFAGITIGLEAEGELASTLRKLCAGLGARWLSLHGVDRARYHTAAVFASNYVVALHAAATRVWELAGLPGGEARAALSPLTLGAAASIADRPLADALTGPVARGDVATVEGHLAALACDLESLQLYRSLGRELLLLGLPHDAAARARLSLLFADEGG